MRLAKTSETLNNGLQTQYSYDPLSKRLTSTVTADIATLQERFRRDFTYDLAGNVRTISSQDTLNANEIMRYSYDHRDRVTNACAVSSTSSSVCIGAQPSIKAMATMRLAISPTKLA